MVRRVWDVRDVFNKARLAAQVQLVKAKLRGGTNSGGYILLSSYRSKVDDKRAPVGGWGGGGVVRPFSFLTKF